MEDTAADTAVDQQEQQTIYDMTSEFTCFLNNGYTSVVGSVAVNEAGIKLCSAVGQLLEIDTFDDIVSVNEIEPLNSHTVVLTFCPQRYVMVSYLLRKEKFTEVFKDLGIYRSKPHLTPESIGMKNPEAASAEVDITNSSTANRSSSQLVKGMLKESRGQEKEEVEISVKDLWSRQLEREQIRHQSELNPIQMTPIIQQTRASELSGNNYGIGSMQKVYGDNDQLDTSHMKTTEQITSNLSSSLSDRSEPHSDGFAVNMANLKLLFPNHQEDELEAVLTNCGCNLDSAISVILGENDNYP